MGWNLVTLAKRYDIEGRLIISNMSKEVPADSVERLNLIYNACEVGINTSTGEGWGLVSFEHAQLARHKSCRAILRAKSYGKGRLNCWSLSSR